MSNSSSGYELARRKNWVEKTGGLPRTIRRIARHLQKKGFSESHAIAVAVNAVKKGAATGDLNWPGVQRMGPKGRARYARAAASWLRKRARARATSEDAAHYIELAKLAEPSQWTVELDELAEETYQPPKAAAAAARRGLELRRKYGRGGTAVGVARARDLMTGKALPLSTVKRMKAYGDRHQKEASQSEDTAGRIAWLLWGGTTGHLWAASIVRRAEMAELAASEAAPNYILEVREYVMEAMPDGPEGWSEGEDSRLIDLYALLALTEGESVTAKQVHDAWAVWRNHSKPDHKSIVPFNRLTDEVKKMDEPYVGAIKAAAAKIGQSANEMAG